MGKNLLSFSVQSLASRMHSCFAAQQPARTGTAWTRHTYGHARTFSLFDTGPLNYKLKNRTRTFSPRGSYAYDIRHTIT